MRKPAFTLLSATLLGLLLACNGTGSADMGNNSSVTVQAAFQKEVLNSAGGHTMTTLPARYCLVKFYDNASNAETGTGGFLDGTGQGTFQVPSGESVYAKVYADWAVPGLTASAPAFMQGYTVNAPYSQAFNSSPDWYVTSNTFTVSNGTLSVLALDDANRLAGAFNIADQGVTFALGMQSLVADPSLPSVAVYWSTSTNPADQYRAYPDATPFGTSMVTINSRVVLQASVMGNASGAVGTEQDEWDDGTLGETYAHLLFAPYTFKADGSNTLSYLRADTENVPFISLGVPSEPSQAFICGFADFLSSAFRGNPQILDSYGNGTSTPSVQDEDLSHPANLGEFSRYGVAGSLWSMWGALGGNHAGLQTLWNATLTSNSGLDFVGDYNGSPLGCFPTYLVGLRAAVGSTWPACQTAFGAWGVSDPSNTYFSTGSALWTNEATPFSVTGATLVSPATPAAASLSYDRNGAALYRFTQGSTGTRTIQMTPTGGQDFELDLIGPNGPIVYNYASPFGTTRTINTPTLAPGSYVIRVRINPSNTLSRAANTYAYNLSLN